MIVVSDTSPLTYLHQIQRIALLQGLYGEVIIPPAVEQELKHAADIHVGLDWSVLRVVQPRNSDAVDSLSKTLDIGESEAIVVASEIKADLLLIDEADGREVARRMGVRLTGLLGVLLEAKRRGLVPAVSPEIARLQESTSFRIRPDVELAVPTLGKRDVSAPPGTRMVPSTLLTRGKRAPWYAGDTGGDSTRRRLDRGGGQR